MNQTFTFDEAFNASKTYFGGDELAAKVWANKYALKDSEGNLYEKTPEDMHHRLAKEIARIESKYPNPMTEEEIFETLDKFKYIVPQGGPMTGIGNNFKNMSTSNCFQYDTEIITNEGIKKIGDCVGTTQVLYSKNGKWVESTINSYGKQELYKLTLGRLGSEKIIYVTGNHRWFTKDKAENVKELTTIDLQKDDELLSNMRNDTESFLPWHVVSLEKTDRVEEVYCADVPEYHCFTLADGILTGNCFVIGIDGEPDSYGAIMKIDEEQIQISKMRGGVGHDLSHLRPSGMKVSNAALTSTGAVSFMERYSNSTREVGQGGRRGALMLSLSINHPDADKFIDAKMEEGKITGANISVRIDDEFMDAVSRDEAYIQKFPIHSPAPQMTKSVKARELWNKVVHNAWKSAEPGVLFWDTIIRESVPDCYADLGFKTVSTNPCKLIAA